MAREPVDWFEVVAKLEAGDDAALLRLTDLVATLLARIGAYRSEEGMEDLIQEVSLALVQSVRRGAIAERDRFLAYAWSVARNRWINHLKARSRRRPGEPDIDPEELSAGDLAPGAGPETEGRDPGMRIDLERALTALPDEERQVIEAVYLRGQSYAEAAQALGLALGTLKRRQSSGLRRLRERMQIDGSFS
jgi:RNA polymerase sigma-70 factor (ECF subfamily)